VTTVRDTREKFEKSVRSVILSKTLGPSITQSTLYYMWRAVHILYYTILCARCIVLSAHIDRCRRPPTSIINNNSSSIRVHRRSWCIVVLLYPRNYFPIFRNPSVRMKIQNETPQYYTNRDYWKITFEAS